MAHAYYVEDNPVATDEEYDKLYHQVLDYEEKHSDEVAIDSPTKRVGGVVRDEFSKAQHISVCGAWKMFSRLKKSVNACACRKNRR